MEWDSRSQRIAYIRGGFAALDQVLNLLNTLENKEIPKKDIYKMVMELRPELPIVDQVRDP